MAILIKCPIQKILTLAWQLCNPYTHFIFNLFSSPFVFGNMSKVIPHIQEHQR